MKHLFYVMFLLSLTLCWAQDAPCCAADEVSAEEKSLLELLSKFVQPDADCAKLSEALVPTEKEFKAFFAQDAARIMAAYQEGFKSKPILISPKKDQTKVVVFCATIEQIQKKEGEAKHFPYYGLRLYKKVHSYIAPKANIYYAKFVAEPKDEGKLQKAKDTWANLRGTGYEGFVCVENKWVYFPTPWKYIGHGAVAEEDKEIVEILNHFVEEDADQSKLSQELVPTEKEFKGFFKDESWEEIMKGYQEDWKKHPISVTPKKEQTKISIWKATVEQIEKGEGDAKFFPKDMLWHYKKLVPHIRPNQAIFYVRFVKPEENKLKAKWAEVNAYVLEAIACVEGKWVVFPKAWKMIK